MHASLSDYARDDYLVVHGKHEALLQEQLDLIPLLLPDAPEGLHQCYHGDNPFLIPTLAQELQHSIDAQKEIQDEKFIKSNKKPQNERRTTGTMLEIGDEHLARFNEIRKRFMDGITLPEEANWKSLSDNDIWLYMVEQVIVVGSSSPASKFREDDHLRRLISYEELLRIDDENEVGRRIHLVLRAVGSRYSCSDINRCKKTKALTHNFGRLRGFEGGPRGLLKFLSETNGKSERIRFLMRNFQFMGSKNARDFLMGLGLLRDAVALDARLKNVFAKMGIELPRGFESNPRLYDEVEKDILEKICSPLGLSGVELDRLFYQNYREITRMNF